MLSKSYFQSAVQKYYLNGTVESTRWSFKDNNLYIDFVSPASDLVGSIIAKEINIKNAEIAIYDTTRLLRLLTITDKDIFVDLTKKGTTYSKLTIADNQFDLIYSLADLSLIRKAPDVEEPTYELSIELSNSDINSLAKAKNALNDTADLVFNLEEEISGNGKKVEIKFGNDDEFSDRVSYYCRNVTTELSSIPKITYNANLLKEILVCNKEMEKAEIFISLAGLMKISFVNDKIESKYFLVQNENGD